MFSSTRHGRFERLEDRTLFSLSHFLVDSSLPEESLDSALISLPEISGLRAASVELTYNQDAVKIDPKSLRAGSIWGNRGLAVANVDEEAGRIVAFIFASREVPAGAGSLLEFDFAHNDPNSSEKGQIEFVIETISLNEGKIEIDPEGEGTAEITWSGLQNERENVRDDHPNPPFTEIPQLLAPIQALQRAKTLLTRPVEFAGPEEISRPIDKKISPSPLSRATHTNASQSALHQRASQNVSLKEISTNSGASWSPLPPTVSQPDTPSLRPTHNVLMTQRSILAGLATQVEPQVVYGPEELRSTTTIEVEELEQDLITVPTQLQSPGFQNSKPAVDEPFDRSLKYGQPKVNYAWLVDQLWSLPHRGSPRNTTVIAPDCWYLMEPETDREISFHEVLPPVLPSPAISLKAFA